MLQGAELETEYTLVEAGLAPKHVKKIEFNGRAALVEELANGEPAAVLCTMTVDDNVSSDGTPRFIVGDNWPLLDPVSKSVLIDAKGRRSRVRRVGYGPSVGEQIVMGYLPRAFARIGGQVLVEYFGEHYALTVRSADRTSLFDPDKKRVRKAESVVSHSGPAASELSRT